eukprot:SAG11_NODE_196_length_12778_cov_6.887767_1_plen_219_part_00
MVPSPHLIVPAPTRLSPAEAQHARTGCSGRYQWMVLSPWLLEWLKVTCVPLANSLVTSAVALSYTASALASPNGLSNSGSQRLLMSLMPIGSSHVWLICQPSAAHQPETIISQYRSSSTCMHSRGAGGHRTHRGQRSTRADRCRSGTRRARCRTRNARSESSLLQWNHDKMQRKTGISAHRISNVGVLRPLVYEFTVIQQSDGSCTYVKYLSVLRNRH